MADDAKTKEQLKKLTDPQERERMKREIAAAQREQEKKNRARSTGSMGGKRPGEAAAEQDQEPQPAPAPPVYDSDEAAAYMGVIMPDAPGAPLAAEGEQYTLFGELTPAEKLRAHVSELSAALEKTILAMDADPAKEDSFAVMDAMQGSTPGTAAGHMATVYADLLSGIGSLREFTQSPEFDRLAGSFADFTEWVEGTRPQRTMADFLFLGSVIDYYRPILPFFLDEIDRLKQEPGRENLTLKEFMRNMDGSGNTVESLFERTIKAAAEKATAAAGTEAEAAAIEKGIERLPMITALTASSHVMVNNPLMNALQQKPAINAGAFDLVVANANGRRKEITAYAMVTYDPGDTGVTMTDPHLTEYERQVSDAVISLWAEAAKRNAEAIFTPDMIFRAMPGGSDKPSAQQRGAIVRTIEKLRRLHITLDATEEMIKRGVIPPGETWRIDDFYLSVRRIENVKVKGGGRQANYAYLVTMEPIILTYSNLTNQLLTVPAKYIAIEKVKRGKPSGELLPMTADRQAMTGYLLRRIAVMKHDRKNKHPHQSNAILFDTLFTETGQQTDNREINRRNREFCFDVLDYWKATGYIKDYTRQQKGRSITGIEIIL